MVSSYTSKINELHLYGNSIQVYLKSCLFNTCDFPQSWNISKHFHLMQSNLTIVDVN